MFKVDDYNQSTSSYPSKKKLQQKRDLPLIQSVYFVLYIVYIFICIFMFIHEHCFITVCLCLCCVSHSSVRWCELALSLQGEALAQVEISRIMSQTNAGIVVIFNFEQGSHPVSGLSLHSRVTPVRSSDVYLEMTYGKVMVKSLLPIGEGPGSSNLGENYESNQSNI